WNLADSVDVPVALHRPRVDTRDRTRGSEEVLDDLWDEPTFAGLGRFPHQSPKVQLSLGETLQRRGRDFPKALRIAVADDPRLKVRQVHPPEIHVAKQLLQQVGRKYLAYHVEHLIRSELAPDLEEALEQLGEDSPLAGVDGNEVEDQAVVLLAVAVDT